MMGAKNNIMFASHATDANQSNLEGQALVMS